jgi:hippurate hydrolase
MVNDGMMDRFGIEEVYGMHNYQGMPVGQFGMRPGPIMAAADYVSIEIEGKGAHAARPHLGIDPILVGSQIVNQLQSIVSRNVDPLEAGVVSICVFQAGTTNNVIPQTAKLAGTIRSLTDAVRNQLETRVRNLRGRGELHGATARIRLTGYPVTVTMPSRPHSRRSRLRDCGSTGRDGCRR